MWIYNAKQTHQRAERLNITLDDAKISNRHCISTIFFAHAQITHKSAREISPLASLSAQNPPSFFWPEGAGM